MPAKHAAEACGVAESTYHLWRKKGREGEEPFATFDSLAQQASARWPIPLLAAIRAAAKDDWRAAAWILERRDPENFGKREAAQAENASQNETKITLHSRPQVKSIDS